VNLKARPMDEEDSENFWGCVALIVLLGCWLAAAAL
jgi:hypothetical protein